MIELKSLHQTQYGKWIGVKAVGTIEQLDHFRTEFLEQYPTKQYKVMMRTTSDQEGLYQLSISRLAEPL